MKRPLLDRRLVKRPLLDRRLVQRLVVDRRLMQRPLLDRRLMQRLVAERRLVQRPVAERWLVKRPMAGLAASVLVGLTVTGCLPTGRAAPVAVLPGGSPAVQHQPSALVVALDPADPAGSAAQARALLAATGRDGEAAVVTCGGRVLASASYPAWPAAVGVGSAPVEAAGATQFQQHQFQASLAKYQKRVAASQAAQAGRHRDDVALWAASLVSGSAKCGPAGGRAAFDVAASTFSGLSQAGADFGARRVLVLTGPMTDQPDLSGETLPGVTVVLPDFAGTAAGQADWRVRLQQVGVARSVVLGAGISSEAGTVVDAALSGSVAVPLPAELLFQTGSAELKPGPQPGLQQMLTTLLVDFPKSQATVNGYTDSVGDPARNTVLSQQRADTVKAWLVAHGVASTRVSAIGHGADDPVAPNLPGGQPANRRVVLLVDSAG